MGTDWVMGCADEGQVAGGADRPYLAAAVHYEERREHGGVYESAELCVFFLSLSVLFCR